MPNVLPHFLEKIELTTHIQSNITVVFFLPCCMGDIYHVPFMVKITTNHMHACLMRNCSGLCFTNKLSLFLLCCMGDYNIVVFTSGFSICMRDSVGHCSSICRVTCEIHIHNGLCFTHHIFCVACMRCHLSIRTVALLRQMACRGGEIS